MKPVLLKVGALFLLLVGLFCLVAGGMTLRKAKASRSWPTTTGKVLSAKVVEVKGRRTRYRPKVEYEYEVGGKTLRSDQVWVDGSRDYPRIEKADDAVDRFRVGKKVTVFYDPADPSESALVVGTESSAWTILFAGGFMLLVSPFLLFKARRRTAAAPAPSFAAHAVSARNRERFEAMVKRAEELSAADPFGYRRRVLWLGVGGYAYVFGIILGLVAAIAGLLWLGWVGNARYVVYKLVIALFVLLGVALRGLWVRTEAPNGIRLTGAQVPALFDLIRDVCARLDAPRVHRVLLTPEFNAGISQVPRLGWLGFHRNYLVLGLPLVQALSPEQFVAVLAHEFGHLSGAHGRLGQWIYRIRSSWMQIVERLEKNQVFGSFLFLPFFRWYAPRFEAFSFVLARQHEYEADLSSVDFAGARASADALVQTHLSSRFLDEVHWTAIQERSKWSPTPDVAPHGSLRESLRRPRDRTKDQKWLEEALARETSLDDTHPCPRERLQAMKMPARVPPPSPRSAAEEYLRDELPILVGQLDRKWADWVKPFWTEDHKRYQSLKTRIEELDRKSKGVSLTHDEEFERARAREEFQGREAGLAAFQEILQRIPDHLAARFAVGRLLLQAGDEQGLEHLNQVMNKDADAIGQGCLLAFQFLMARSRKEEAEAYRERALQHGEKHRAAEQERSQILFDGRYSTHGIDAQTIARLIEVLRRFPEIVRAFLVRRDVEHFPERPLLVLGVTRSKTFLERLIPGRTRKLDLLLQDRIGKKLEFMPETFILALNHRSRKERRLFNDVPDSNLSLAS